MNIFVFLGGLAVLSIICFIIGSKSSTGQKDAQDYFLGSRTVLFYPLMMTFVATQIGGGVILGTGQEAHRFGWFALLYPLGICIGFLLLAAGIGKKIAAYKASTIPQLLEIAFNSPTAKKMASVISMVSLFTILMAQVIASKGFMNAIGVENDLLFAMFWLLIIGYTVLGGLKAVIATDVFQATFFIAILIACFGYAVINAPINFSELFEYGMSVHKETDASMNYFGWIMMPTIFIVIGQDMAQRCFSAKSPKIISMSTLAAAVIIALVCIIPMYFGILARATNLNIPEGSSILISSITAFTNPTFTALAACCILAAIISTADSLINALTSNLAQDFQWGSKSSKLPITTLRMMTAVVSLLAVAASFLFEQIIGVLLLSYALYASCLTVPVFAAIFRVKSSERAVIASILSGGAVFCLSNFITLPMPGELAAMTASLISFAVLRRSSYNETTVAMVP